jgi:5-dehydro-4-deoxyglucarate dehydratase
MASYPFCSLVVTAGAGELYSLTPAEAVEVMRISVSAVRGRMPVMGGVGYSVPLAVEMARGMEKTGADGLLIFPPYYPNAPFEGLCEYYAAIGRSTALPLAIYSRDWAAFTPAQVARLAERVPTLEIWKDGQGDARKLQRIMAHCGDRLAWVGGAGDDCAAAYFAIGCQAYTSSVSIVCPALSIALAEAGKLGDFARLNELLVTYVHPLFGLRERKRGYEVALLKRMLDAMGKYGGPVRPPLESVSGAEEAEAVALSRLYEKDFR